MIKQILSMLFVLSILAGCTTNPDETILDGSNLRLYGSIGIENTLSSRAEYFDTKGDSDVETLRMLVFAQKDGALVKNIVLNDQPTNLTDIKLVVKIEDCTLGANYFIRFVANRDIADDLDNYADISSLSVGRQADERIGVRTPLVMISDSLGFTFDTPEINLGSVVLKRKAARMVIHYDNLISAVNYLQIEGSEADVPLFGKIASEQPAEPFIIHDKTVGLGGKIDEKTAYYYIYPKPNQPLKLTASIDGRERTRTISEGVEANTTYSFRFNYNTTLEDYRFDEALTTYDPSQSAFSMRSAGDVIELTIKENSTIEIPADISWISASTTTRASDSYQLKVRNNSSNQERSAKITVKDPLNPLFDKVFTIRQQAAKYMVVVVAGQSNALGVDESVIDQEGLHKTNPRTFQLSYRRGINQPNLDISPLHWRSDDIHNLPQLNASGLVGAKSIHQPLGKQLLEKFKGTKYEDYDILVIPVSYGGTAFTLGSVGTYDPVMLAPKSLGKYKWDKNSPYATTIIDRVKYAMNLNEENKLVGFVWCQGENDRANYKEHIPLFEAMAQEIFDQLNNNGYGSRVSKGVIDKDSWYVFTPPVYYLDYYLKTTASHVFAIYKSWSPNTFVYIEPKEEYTNKIGGNGNFSKAPTSHFGNNAYITVIAPRVIECMDKNGSLFNGNSNYLTHYTDTTTAGEANSEGGALTDDDIANGLIAHLPFNNSVEQELVGQATVTPNGSVEIAPTSGLVDIDRNPRDTKALALNTTGAGVTISDLGEMSTFSISLMVKRTGNFTNTIQRILTLGENANTSALEYKSLVLTTTRRPELMFEPVVTNTINNVVVAQFIDALTLRSEQDWMHILITHDATTKTTTFYLNGQQVNQRTMTALNNVKFNRIVVGESATIANGVNGNVANLMLWNRVITPAAMRKLFLYNYYGFSK